MVSIEQISERGYVVSVDGRRVGPIYQYRAGARQLMHIVQTAIEYHELANPPKKEPLWLRLTRPWEMGWRTP
jgi:hypothetical protein